MIKHYFFSLLLLALMGWQVEVAGQYCSPTYSTGCAYGDGLTSFVLGTINQPIGCTTSVNDFTSQSTSVMPGTTTTLALQAGYSSTYFIVWVDLNNNSTFEETEQLINGLCSSASTTYNFDLTIPSATSPGNKTLRILTNWNSAPTQGPCGSYSYGNSSDFTLSVGALSACDLAAMSWDLPELSSTDLSASETVKVTVKNMGTTTQSGFTLAYTIDGGLNYVSEVVSTSILPGESYQHTFATAANFLAAGTYQIGFNVSLACDTVSETNNIYNGILANATSITSYPYFSNFDSPNANLGWTSSGTANSWQYGSPTNTNINAAYSAPNCWITNLTGNYNTSENSWVESPFFNFSTLVAPILEMKLNYITENNYDGAAIQYSIDGGVTWYYMGTFQDTYGTNWYNNNSTYSPWAGTPKWSNNSNGWITVKYKIYENVTLMAALSNQVVKFRVNFRSDTSGNYQGVAFDDFALYNAPEFDAEMLAILNPYNQVTGNNALSPIVIIKNQGTSNITACTINYSVNGGAVSSYSYSGSIATAQTDTISLPSYMTAASGTGSFKVWVDLANDPLHSNDTLTKTYSILPYACNYAMYFDGVNDWVEILNDTSLNSTSYTIEAWIKPASFGWLEGIVSRYMPGGNGYVLRMSPTSPYNKINFNEADANYTLTANTWYHLAAVNNNGVNTLYINGVAFSVGGNNMPNNSGKIAIGNDYMERWFNGLIDEVRIWKTALPASAINDWMAQPVTNLHPQWASMAAYYTFDQPAALAYDSKNSNHGIVHEAQFQASDLSFICEDNDAWLNAFVSPQGQSVEGTSLTPKVVVKNMGFNTITSLNLYYTVNGGSTVSYAYSGNILTAQIDTLELPAFISGSGNNTIKAWLVMSNDINQSNDTLQTTFTALPVVCNYGLDLQGTSQFGQFPAGQYFGNNFTVEAWVYKRSNNYSSRLIDFGNGSNNNNILIQLNDGSTSKIRFSIRQGTSEQAILSNATIPLNQWVHIACTYDGVAGRIYINGVEDINGSLHNPLPVVRADNFLGKSNWTGDGFANIIVDEFKFWNATLLPATIQSYMNVPPSAAHPNYNMLSMYYDFNSPVDNPVIPVTGSTPLNLIGAQYSTTSAPVVCDPYDAAITNIVGPAGMIVETQSIIPQVLLTNLGVQNLTSGLIYYTFGPDTLVYTFSGTLYLGQSDTVTLPAITVPNGTSANLCAWVVIPNDANTANNGSCRTYTVMPNACNYAMYFDGSGDYVNIPVSPETEQLTNIYTLECWFKPEEFGFLDGLISKYQNSGQAGFQLRMSQTSPYTGLNFDEQNAGPVLVANQWYHVAAVNNNGQHKLYVNGVEYLTSASAVYNPNNTGIRFAVDYGDRWFKGYMDEVRIWKAALTQADVQAWMQQSLNSSHPEYVNLVGYWEFDDLAPTATDSKANHHGVIYNAVYKPCDAPIACGFQDAGVISFVQPTTNYFTGNYNALSVNVYNYGTDPITSLDLYYTVNNGAPVNFTWTGNIPSLGTQLIQLPPFIGPASGPATITVSTNLFGDLVVFNNTKSKTVTGISPYEIALLNIAGPAGGCGLSDEEHIQLTIKNNGDSIMSGLVVNYMSLPDSIVYTENVTDTVLPLQQFVYTFDVAHDMYVGTGDDSTYTFKAWISMPNDAVTTNNSLNFSIESVHASDSPTGNDTTIVFGSTATLHGYSPYTVYWFENQNGGTSVGQGQDYTTPPLYDTTTYWIEASASVPYTATIGTGTTANSYVPLYGYYDYSWSSAIYKAADIGSAMKITSLWYYVANSPNNYTTNNQKVYLKHITANTYSSNAHPDFSSMQSVFEGTIVWSGGGWKQIVLTTPFNYNGVDNLEVGWQNYDGSYLSGYPTFRYTSTASSAKYKYADYNYPATTGTITSYRPNIKFEGSSLGCPSERYPVTALVTNIPQYDLSVDAMLSPQSGYVLSNCEDVIVNITNWGANDVTNFPINLVMDNGYSTTEIFQGTLASGMSASYTFVNCINLSAIDTFTVCVYISIPNDSYSSNDSICMDIINSELSYCQSNATSTSYIEVVQFNIGTNWSNYSGPAYGATYTDFTNLAPAQLIIGQNVSTYLKPQHYGSSWDEFSNYKIYIDYNQDGQFDPTTEMAFGTNVWGQNGSYGQITIPQSATPGTTGMRLVFNRTSDPAAVTPCGTYSYGETEDYMITLSAPIAQDAGITEIIDPSGYMIQNGSEAVKVRLQNFGSQAITTVDISYTIDGGMPVTYTWTGNLAPFSNTLVTLQNIIVPVMNFDFCAYTALTGDLNSNNDTLCVSLYGNPQYQASLNSVSGLVTGCNLGLTNITIAISNLADTIQPGMLTVYYHSNGMANAVTETINQVILPAQSLNYTFATPYDQTVSVNTEITMNVWINLINDPFTANDSITQIYWSSVPPADPIIPVISIYANEQALVNPSNPATSAIYNWYNEYMSLMYSGSSFLTPALTDTTIYKVIANNPANMGGCSSAITEFVVNVIYADLDAKLIDITSPTSGSYLTNNEPVTIIVSNNGLLPISNFNVGYSVNGGTAVVETITSTIQPGASLTYTFADSADLFVAGYGPGQDGYGIYSFCAFTMLTNDEFNGNDSLCVSIENMNGDGINCVTSFEYGEVNSPAVQSSITYSGDVEWYSFTATTDYTNVAVSLCGSSYDTYLSVWNDCGASSALQTNDDYCGLQSQINFGTLSAGTYYVRVYAYSSNFGNFTLNITGTQVAPFTLSLTPAPVSCYNGSNGSIDLTVNNLWGLAPFTYLWSDGSTSEDVNGLIAGTYFVTVSDANSNTASASVVVDQPLDLISTPAITAVTSLGGNNGEISLTVSGGTAPYTYNWNTGATTASISGLYGGIYQVTITDANYCNWNYSYEVTAPVPTGWAVTTTTNTHLIYVPASSPKLLDGTPVPLGSYFGAFYYQGTTLACGGYFIWNGYNLTMTTYGSTGGQDNGFNPGETFVWKLYHPLEDEVFNTTAAYATAYPNQDLFAVGGLSGINSLNAISIVTQTINLPEGWSMWSTYIIPPNPNMVTVLNEITQPFNPLYVVIVKNGAGMIYWPQYNINNIGNVQINQGYQIKVATPAQTGTSFHVTGIQIVPETTPISIPTGWNIISYLRSVPGNIATIMAPIAPPYSPTGCVAIMKNYAGNIFWPVYNLNTIGNMIPGQGYQVKNTCGTLTLTYPANSLQLKSNEVPVSKPQFFGTVSPSGNNMTIGIPLSAWETTPEINDEIAVYDNQHNLRGSAVFTGDFTAITVWGDEMIEEANAKAASFELFFEIYKNGKQALNQLFVGQWEEGSGVYQADQISVAAKVRTIAIKSDIDQLGQNQPNPFVKDTRIPFTLARSGKVKLSVYNALGEEISVLIHSELSAGNHEFEWNSNLPAGNYYYQLITQDSSLSKSFSVQK